MTNPLLNTSGLPQFSAMTPEQVLPAINLLINRNRETLQTILKRSPDFESLVLPLEEMAHELSRVWSPVSHLQGVIGSAEWRKVYEEALPLLTEYSTEISQNEKLQAAFAELSAQIDETSPEDHQSIVEHALRDFKLAGVDLDEAKKTRFREISKALAEAQARFANNVQDATDAWTLEVSDREDLKGLPPHAIDRAESEGASGFLLRLDFPTYQAVLTHAENRALRETFYKAWATRASDQGDAVEFDNTEVIRNILDLRFEAANIVGFETYAALSLARKMADSPDQVVRFLRDLAHASRGAAQKELEQIGKEAGYALEAWDVSFWLERLKTRRYEVSNEEIRSYFPVDRSVSGIFELASRLYGLTVKESTGVDTWHPDVRYFTVADQSGEQIGGFYADLFARSGKRAGAWIDVCVSRKWIGDEKALPVGYLVCNFTPRDEDGRSFLTHDELVTLFHEFGHMLHHLLTRIDYPSIAGINGVPWDAVELPSQFMENFAWNYDVLVGCSAHRDTGEPLPKEIFDRLNDGRHFGAALAMLRQLEFALFDFRLHHEYSSDTDILGLLDEVRGEVSMVTHPHYNRHPHSFAHIFAGGYAAGYYSYKWAEVLAADAFAAFREHGIFDPSIARLFRTEILEVGGSRDFMDAYVAFRGREPTTEALLRQSGIA